MTRPSQPFVRAFAPQHRRPLSLPTRISRLCHHAALALLLTLLCVPGSLPAYGQAELVPPDHPVYRFLLRQSLDGTVRNYPWGMLPLSRGEIASHLDTLAVRGGLEAVDAGLLADYSREFGFERTGNLTASHSVLPSFDLGGLVSDERQKFLYAYADSSVSVFVDLFASYSYRSGWGDSAASGFASLGELGIRVRGTFHGVFGYYVQASNGALLGGDHDFASLDPRLRATKKFNEDQKKYYDLTTGYLRYDNGWLGIMLGREQILWGFGYADRHILSSNAPPLDYFRIDLRSGSVRYSFLHGSIVGADSNGRTLDAKYIAAHRLEFGIGSLLRLGLNEAVIYSNQPINFALMNPFVFLTSAELSTELPEEGDNRHNTIIMIDVEVTPIANLRLSGSFIMDELRLEGLGEEGDGGNRDKFGYQAGVLWSRAFTVPALIAGVEYARLNPFTLSHWTNDNGYSHWQLPLGPEIPPNSDQWTVFADYDITNRLAVAARFKFRRSGLSVIDSTGSVAFDAGNDLLHGSGHLDHANSFLQGRRLETTYVDAVMRWQPVWQYVLEFRYMLAAYAYPDEGRSLTDSMVWLTARVEY